MNKPTVRQVRNEIKSLRKFIEDDSNDPLQVRVAQVKEETLRWAMEDTDWESPVKETQMAEIIRNEIN